MKITLKHEDGTSQTQDVTSFIITLSSGETLEISEESAGRPAHLCEGVTVWGGRMPEQNASIDQLKAATRLLGIYPMAANMIHLFPLRKAPE
ncbi:hypothetical protein [Pantoea sp. C2G6]|uniref:hypothetical protein n=1 Tax=Pantoea sp. C2G6 TaxID=3243084 RepID=UPI003ED8D0C6